MSPTATRVLVVYGGGPEAARSAREVVAQWRESSKFEVVGIMSGVELVGTIPVCENHDDELLYDITIIRSMCDVLIVHASSGDEGFPPDDFGAFHLSLLSAANATTTDDGLHLAGLQHAVLGTGHAQRDGCHFQNVPRLADKYLGECGSRRLAMRVEIDEALEGGAAQRRAFAASTFEALEAQLSHGMPSVCAWTVANGCTVGARADLITPKTAEQLAAHRPHENDWGDIQFAGYEWLAVPILGAILAFCYWVHAVYLPSVDEASIDR